MLVIITPARAYSEMVSRIHGMDEAGVRFPVGPRVQKRARFSVPFLFATYEQTVWETVWVGIEKVDQIFQEYLD